MKVYKIDLGHDNHSGQRGYIYQTSKKEVDKIMKEFNDREDTVIPPSVTEFELRLGKVEVLAALNQHGGHCDNG